jgi:hypothetical protein
MDIRAARTDGEFFGRQDEYFPTPLNGELVVLKRTTVGFISTLCLVKDGPHCITWTHAEEVNSELANFLGKGAAQRAASAPQHEAVA